jgi:cell wall-associated NlpC family hydrolase
LPLRLSVVIATPSLFSIRPNYPFGPMAASPPVPDLRPYLGLPYLEHGRSRAGIDCWGLVVVVYAESLRIALPAYDTVWPDDRAAVDTAARAEADKPLWREVEERSAILFDVILFERGGLRAHCGLSVAAGRVLHVRAHGRSAAVAYASDPFLARQSRRFYRHRDR